jgi:hypothetical protein
LDSIAIDLGRRRYARFEGNADETKKQSEQYNKDARIKYLNIIL